MKKRTKTLLLCGVILVLAAVSFLGIWYLSNRSPAGNGNVLGVSWYHENGTEFTISTADELYELAELSKYYDFEGQTIKLGADIVVNKGVAADWETKLPEHLWYPIEGFAGTFDGQGHTISGICGLGDLYGIDEKGKEIIYYPTGLFTNTQAKCVIKDFKLLNSYFFSDLNQGVGSVSSNGAGTFDSIYSDALIVSYKCGNGGIIGMLDGKGSSTISNCWFDGEIRIEGNAGRYSGGIVGRVCQTGGQNKIEHCLSTADLSSTMTGKGVNLGGLVGNVAPAGRISIADSLAVGDVTNKYAIAVGTVIGCIEGSGSANVTNVYGREESFSKVVGAVLGSSIGNPVAFKETMLTGFESYRWTNLDFENYWAIVEEGTPILQYFAEETPAIKGVEKAFDMGWYNKSKPEYTISTLKELYGFCIMSQSVNFSGKTVKLGANIVVNEGDLKDWADNVPANPWIQVGTVTNPFAGTFDGCMNSISGICQITDKKHGGVFASTTESAVVKNFKLIDSYFESSAQSIGSIAGYARGKFDTVYSNATVTSTSGSVSGMIGQVSTNYGVTMTNCWFDGNVIANGNTTGHRRAAGFIGYVMSDTTLNNCLNTGTIDATAYTSKNSATSTMVAPLAGGFAAQILKDKKLTIVDCLNTGEIKVNKVASAGYGSGIGYSDGLTIITGSYATSESCAKTTGGNVSGQMIVVKAADIKGFLGYQWTHLDFDKYWAVVTKDTPILKSFAPEVPSVAKTKRMIDVSWYDGTKNSFVLDSKEDLYGFYIMSFTTNFKGKTVKLKKDITVNTGNAANWGNKAPAYEWKPVGNATYPFAGTFDGQGHTISGLYRNTDQRWCGLFAVTGSTSVVKNLRLTNSYFKTNLEDCGSIAGVAKGTFDTVYSDAIVVAESARVGGFAGQGNGDVVMKNCWFDGTMVNKANGKGQRATGGLLGIMYEGSLTLTNCLNSGVVDVSTYTFNQGTEKEPNISPLAGGLVGHIRKGTKASITECMNTGDVLVSKATTSGYGAVVGYVDTGADAQVSKTWATKESCANTHKGTITTGGIVQVKEEKVTGAGAYQWTLLDFNKHWVATENSLPVLKAFSKGISLLGVKRLVDISWYDADKDTFVLKNLEDLYGFAILSAETDFAGKTVKLGRDIVVNKDIKNPSYTWSPIASAIKPFAGTFDGEMHSISGLYLDTNDRYCAMFAVTSSKSTITNLKLVNSYFKSSAGDCASIVGLGKGTLDTVYSNATVVSSSTRVGGFVGQANGENTVIKNCWFDGTVTNTSNNKALRGTGGLAGITYAKKLDISHCLNSGKVDVSAYDAVFPEGKVLPVAGGFIGQVISGASVAVKDSLNVGKIVTSDSANYGYGPVVGYSDKADAVSLANVYATTESSALFSKSNMTSQIMSVSENGILGYKGHQWTHLNFQKYWAVVLSPAEGTPILQSFASTVPSLAGYDKMIDTSWYTQTAGTESDPYIISDKADLYGLAALSAETDFAGKYIRLAADITVNKGTAKEWSEEAPDYEWTPIGSEGKPFAGTFDGSDPETGKIHSISGIYLKTKSQYGGLFTATAVGSTVKNLKLTNSYFYSDAKRVGSVVGMLMGNLHTIYSDAIVEGNNQAVGGMVGIVGNSAKTEVAITNCWFAGSVTNTSTGGNSTGGIVGHVYTKSLTLTNCLNTATVDATAFAGGAPCVGGLVGYHQAGTLTVNTSVNIGTVKYSSAASNGRGGIVGYANGSSAPVNMSGVYYTVASCRWVSPGATIPTSDYKPVGDIFTESWNNLDKAGTWTIFDSGTPILTAFKNEFTDTVDLTWYRDAQGTGVDPYILRDKEDLNGFVLLSQGNTFAGKVFRLGADIVVNEGTAKDWATEAPETEWTPIGTKSYAFAGIFDGADPETGKIHSISGLYLNNSSSEGNGLFGYVSTGTIKNIKLINSYFYSEVRKLGSIAGEIGAAKLDTLYSDAIVVSAYANDQAFAGGLVGIAGNSGNADVDITNCWFAGTVTNNNDTRDIGGLVGWAYTKTLDIENCMNTGIINAPNTTRSIPRVGGFVGYNQKGALTIKNSIHNASINCPKRANCTVGLNTATLKLTGVYYGGYSFVYSNSGGDVTNATGYIKIESGTDYSALLNSGRGWTAVSGSHPKLTSFAN